MRNVFFTICLSLFALPSSAQGSDPQTRLVLHATADLNQNWFITNWVIGNVKADTPNNVNLFPGVGYRAKNWWLEAMTQRQWSKPGNQWMLDFRYSFNRGRLAFYAESTPLLTKRGEYEFVYADVRVWKRLSVGFETENVHKPGKDSLGAGPRLSLPVASFGNYKLSLAGVYQFRNEANVPRLYVVLNRRFKR